MKPADEIGTLMECCGKLIERELTSEGGIAFATWKCPICGTMGSQVLGEINPEEAEIIEPREGLGSIGRS